MSDSPEELATFAGTSDGSADADPEERNAPRLPVREDLGPDEEDLDVESPEIGEAGGDPDSENLHE